MANCPRDRRVHIKISRMRILYLTPGCFDKGGISRYSRYQISALRTIYGADNVRALSLLGPDEDGIEAAFDVHWHGSSRFGMVSQVDRAAFAIRALGLAAFWRPTAILSAHVNMSPLLVATGKVARAQTVQNVYGLEIWSGLSASRRAHMARAGRVIADCHFTARYVVDEGLHHGRPAVIWDPVDLDRFTPGPTDQRVVDKYGIPDPSEHFVVMSLGRLASAAAHKGFDRLIEVVAPLAAESPRLRLVIAGRGDDQPRLETLAAQFGLGDRIRFTGSIEDSDLPAVYRCAHVFSLVSDRGHSRGEGIPMTPLEAMACGVPIIVGNEDGSMEAVVDGRNGFVVTPRHPVPHREVLAQLMGDAELRAILSREARRVAEEHFSYQGFLEKHRTIFAAVTNPIRAI